MKKPVPFRKDTRAIAVKKEHFAKEVVSLFQFPDFAGFSLRGTGQSYLPRTVLHLMNFNIFSSKNKQNNSLSFLSEHKVSYTRIVRFD